MLGILETRPLTRFAVFVALMLGMIAGVQACSSNPRVDYANAQDTYIAVVQALIENRDKIGEETWYNDVRPLINAGDAALDQYDALTKAGLPTTSPAETLRVVLVALQEFLLRIE